MAVPAIGRAPYTSCRRRPASRKGARRWRPHALGADRARPHRPQDRGSCRCTRTRSTSNSAGRRPRLLGRNDTLNYGRAFFPAAYIFGASLASGLQLEHHWSVGASPAPNMEHQMNGPTLLPPRMAHLDANGTTALFEPLTPWLPTIYAAALLRVVVWLGQRSSNFQCKVAVQTATTDPSEPNAAVAVGSWMNTVSRFLVSFDPNGASNGDFANHMWWRLGLVYGSTSASVESGDVTITPSYR